MMKTIPETSPDNYLSGMASLNIPSADGTGDWHLLGTFSEKNTKPLRFIADRTLISILGQNGIVDRSKDADEYGIPHDGPLW